MKLRALIVNLYQLCELIELKTLLFFSPKLSRFIESQHLSGDWLMLTSNNTLDFEN